MTHMELKNMIDALPLEKKIWLIGYLISGAGVLISESAHAIVEALSVEDLNALLDLMS